MVGPGEKMFDHEESGIIAVAATRFFDLWKSARYENDAMNDERRSQKLLETARSKKKTPFQKLLCAIILGR
jgi:hypothetical protein